MQQRRGRNAGGNARRWNADACRPSRWWPRGNSSTHLTLALNAPALTDKGAPIPASGMAETPASPQGLRDTHHEPSPRHPMSIRTRHRNARGPGDAAVTRMSHTYAHAGDRAPRRSSRTNSPAVCECPGGEKLPSGYLVDLCLGVTPGCRPFQGCKRWECPWGTTFQKVCEHPPSSAFSFRLTTLRAWRCK